MKKTLFIIAFLISAISFGQSLKSLTSNANQATSKVLNNDMLDKLASDQVSKLTKKLSLSESQQSKANDLVMKQLRSPKLQEMLTKFTADQLLGSKGSNELTQTLLKEPKFTNELGSMLNPTQLKTFKEGLKF